MIMQNPPRRALVRTSPSLALVKYWGKMPGPGNHPATPSIAVTLDALHTETGMIVRDAREGSFGDHILINGSPASPERNRAFLEGLREQWGASWRFHARSRNNFPTAAGLASSSSGFAALVLAGAAALGKDRDPAVLSALARVGSGSAARCFHGGFTLFEAGSSGACALAGPGHWPDLRILVVRVEEGPKSLSSREGMERTMATSPFYQDWVDDAPALCARARDALLARDIESLGPLIRMSYLRMFSTMFSADPPWIYWKPLSLSVIHACAELRSQGIQAWETMDAGPQVKVICLASQIDRVREVLGSLAGADRLLEDRPGKGPLILSCTGEEDLLQDIPEEL